MTCRHKHKPTPRPVQGFGGLPIACRVMARANAGPPTARPVRPSGLDVSPPRQGAGRTAGASGRRPAGSTAHATAQPATASAFNRPPFKASDPQGRASRCPRTRGPLPRQHGHRPAFSWQGVSIRPEGTPARPDPAPAIKARAGMDRAGVSCQGVRLCSSAARQPRPARVTVAGDFDTPERETGSIYHKYAKRLLQCLTVSHMLSVTQ